MSLSDPGTPRGRPICFFRSHKYCLPEARCVNEVILNFCDSPVENQQETLNPAGILE